MKLVHSVIYQYVSSREVKFPKAMALYVAIETVESLGVTHNE